MKAPITHSPMVSKKPLCIGNQNYGGPEVAEFTADAFFKGDAQGWVHHQNFRDIITLYLSIGHYY